MVISDGDYLDSPATALVFDLPPSDDAYPPNLSREGRYPAAFFGYQDLTTTFSYLRTDDRQNGSFSGYFRRSVTERVGVSYR